MVISMNQWLQTLYPDIFIEMDIQERPGDSLPNRINGHRPDLHAYNNTKSFFVVGEAKTKHDLQNNHTNSQIRSFVEYLEQKPEGIFILAVSPEKANEAKTILRFSKQELNITTTKFFIFDGLDYWRLNQSKGILWDLI